MSESENILRRLKEQTPYTNVLDGELMKDAASAIEALHAENEKLRAERDECERQLQSSFREMGEILEERNVLRVAFEQAANEMRPMLRSMISRGEAAEIVRRAAAAALKETDG